MLFSRKKVPGGEAGSMRICPIDTVRAFYPMPAPTYLLLRGNDKFISVKAPLDFFTPDELERFKPFGAFFFPEFVERVIPFRRGTAALRTLLASTSSVDEGPAPYEVSDAFVRLAAEAWSEGGLVEPFFVSMFVHELFEPIPGQWMVETYVRSVDAYEQGILRSAWATWNAMHLGYLNLGWLQSFRNNVFKVASQITRDRAEIMKMLPEPWMREMATFQVPLNAIRLDRMRAKGEHSKLFSRGERLRTELIKDTGQIVSIFGPGGFRNG